MEQEIVQSLAGEWNIAPEQSIGKEQVLAALAQRIAQLLSGNETTFFQLMYRLDISEHKLNDAIVSANPPENIALLIWDRQLQKIMSRARYSPPDHEDSDLKW